MSSETNPSGGLDLSAVRAKNLPQQPTSAEATPGTGGPGAGAPGTGGDLPENAVPVPALVFDVDESNFEAVAQLSTQVPVVIDLWAEWCGPCKQLSPVLDRVVESYGGKVVLAKIDVDANPNLQQAFGVQSIPTVVALVAARPVPLFQGAVPEPQVRQYFDQLLSLAGQHGVDKVAVPAGAPAPEPAGPAHPEALAALEAGDFDAATNLYQQALDAAPADAEAKLGLQRVGMAKRLTATDTDAALAAAAADPDDLTAGLQAADAEFASGDLSAAFDRLLGHLRRSTGEDKETVRLRLLELFDLAGPEEARVTKARNQLMRALF